MFVDLFERSSSEEEVRVGYEGITNLYLALLSEMMIKTDTCAWTQTNLKSKFIYVRQFMLFQIDNYKNVISTYRIFCSYLYLAYISCNQQVIHLCKLVILITSDTLLEISMHQLM